jgi:hypothetical protein
MFLSLIVVPRYQARSINAQVTIHNPANTTAKPIRSPSITGAVTISPVTNAEMIPAPMNLMAWSIIQATAVLWKRLRFARFRKPRPFGNDLVGHSLFGFSRLCFGALARICAEAL